MNFSKLWFNCSVSQAVVTYALEAFSTWHLEKRAGRKKAYMWTSWLMHWLFWSLRCCNFTSLWTPASSGAVPDTVSTSAHQRGTSNGAQGLCVLWWHPAVSTKVPTAAETVIKAFSMSLSHPDSLRHALKRHYKVSSLYRGTSSWTG